MQMIRFGAWSILAFLLMTACGGRSPSKKPQERVQTIQVGAPIFLDIANNQCPNGLDQLGVYEIDTWDGFSLQADTIDLKRWQSTDSLSSNLVRETISGYSELNLIGDQCRSRRSPGELIEPFCREQRFLRSAGQKLKICDSGDQFERNTVEASALTLAGSLDALERFYQKIFPEKPLESLIVLLFPNIEYRTTYNFVENARLSFSITDNAAWGRRGSRGQSDNVLYVFPMSENYLAAQESRGSPGFWEVPWIIAHEFGHHVFYNMLGPKARRHFGFDMTTFDTVQNLPYHYFWNELQSIASPNDNFNLTSINEGFADLFAHYFRGGSSKEIAQLNCTFRQRDVASPRLNDGRLKTFSALEGDGDGDSPCTKVIGSDVHTQGTVLAYFIDQSMTDLVREMSVEQAVGEKAKLLMEILQYFAWDIEIAIAADRPLDLWPMAVQAVTDLYQRRDLKMPSKQCALVDQVFSHTFTNEKSMSEALKLKCSAR